jgi:endoglucanase
MNMNKQSRLFLEKLMNTPTPSGYEDKGRKIWRDEIKSYADQVHGDVHGNSFAVVNKGKKKRIMLAGHIDELGFQVKYINKEGFIYFNTLGGFDIGIIPGRKVRIHTSQGDLLGVIGRKAIHLIESKDRDKVSQIHELSIDIGATSKEEVEKLTQIGDPITYDNNFEPLLNDLYVSRAFDDKIGAYIVAEVMKNISAKKDAFKASLYSVATCQEEVGLRGAQTSAYTIEPHVGFAIDVTHGTDTPDVDNNKYGEINVGQGVVIGRGPNFNSKLLDLMIAVAKKHKIDYQIESSSRPTGTDANVIQVARSGVATGLLKIPCRYMHTFTEVISMRDVENCVKLLTEVCLVIDDKSDFTL